MKTYIVQLENHDDIISARDKLSWSKANRVLLLWPRKGKVLERRLDLQLLQRHSSHLGVQLAIVTRRGEVKTFARELGIPVFASAEQAQRSAWRRPKARRKIFSADDERVRAAPQTLREQRSQLNIRPVDKRWLRLVMFTLGVLSFLGLTLFFAPGAEVTLKPVRHSQQLSMDVWASPAIHAPNPSGGLPAVLQNVVVEGRDQAASTGNAYVPDQFAAGQVLLHNLTDQLVTVPEGSVVLTLTVPAVRFTVTQAVQIPAGVGKTVKAVIRAALPGSAGNLSPGKIQAMEGPVGLLLTLENPEAIRGGTDSASPAPNEQDYQALRSKLLANLQGSALTEIRGRIKPGQRLLDNTLRLRSVVEETREPQKGRPGDRLQLSLRVEYEAWYVNESDLEAVALAALDANRAPGFQPVPASLDIQFASDPRLDGAVGNPQTLSAAAVPVLDGAASSAAGLDPGTARWQIKAARILEASWSNATLVNLLRGRSLADARRILQSSLSVAEPPRISIYPAVWGRMPYLPARITLVKQ